MSDRTILDPQYANSLNGLFNGTGDIVINDITAEKVTLQSQNTGSNYQLGCYNSLLSINTGSSNVTPQVQLTNGGNNSVTLSVPDNNVLQMPELQLSNSVTSPIYNISGGGSNVDITYNGIGVVIPTELIIGVPGSQVTLTCPTQNLLQFFGQLNCNTMQVSSGISSAYYTGGLYNSVLNISPPTAIQTSTSHQFFVELYWNPAANWTTDTITVIPSYTCDYPVNTTDITLNQTGSTALQIVFTVFNSYGAASNVYAINYVVLNQQPQ
jgi:hypothetical protein